MSFSIRPWEGEKDFLLTLSWWERSGEQPPTQEMIPASSTWILESSGLALLMVSVHFLPEVSFAWIENFCGEPGLKGERRREATKELLKFIEDQCRLQGYEFLFCLSHHEKLSQRYQELGFKKTIGGLEGFLKSI